MDSVLVVSSVEKDADNLSRLLKTFGLEVYTASCASKARRRISETEFNLIIINAPLSDEYGGELAVYLSEKSVAGVLMLVKPDTFGEVCSDTERYGVVCLEKPHVHGIREAVKILVTTSYRMRLKQKENEKLMKKLSEMRVIDRSKLTLMQQLGYTEQEAHKYIEKIAMDTRKTRYEVAQKILSDYDR